MLRTTEEIVQHAMGLCAVLREKCEDTCSEAATMIEVLSKRLEDEREMHMTMGSEVGANYREIGRLKEENEILKQGLEIIKKKYQELKIQFVTFKAAAEVMAARNPPRPDTEAHKPIVTFLETQDASSN